MAAFEDLLHRLDAAGPTGWEDEYAAATVTMSPDQAYQVVNSERAYANWAAFRFVAGPPGEPLPSSEEAVKAVLGGVAGTALDAYRVVFATPPLGEGIPADVLLGLLYNGALCALKQGPKWFASWLAARAGLACIALGMPERAWLFLEDLTGSGSGTLTLTSLRSLSRCAPATSHYRAHGCEPRSVTCGPSSACPSSRSSLVQIRHPWSR